MDTNLLIAIAVSAVVAVVLGFICAWVLMYLNLLCHIMLGLIVVIVVM